MRHSYSLGYKKWDLVKQTPFDKVQLPSGDRKRVRYLKPDEEEKLFKALADTDDWLRSVVIIARETGLRLSNICNLTWNQVDLFKRFIEIEKTKNGKPVWIPLTDLTLGELKKWSKIRDLKSDRVFIIKEKFLHRAWVGRKFRRLTKRAGIVNFRFHDLRHDFCSRLVQAGQPLHVVAALAGHEDISTTQRYAHLSPESKRKAIAVLNGYSQVMTK
ncbi:MAG: site-specific integrase [Candidatus Marinimicrobia bacterium]|nr:site-specific integrase [Candidatus Neomarinimicrobiota bacterium]